MKPIGEHPDYYALDSGEIISGKHGMLRMLVPHEVKGGYLRVRVTHNGKSRGVLVHRLVAMTFCRREGARDEVNHKDGNKLNNRADNLEWTTRGENLLHSYRVLGNPPPRSRSVLCVETGVIYPSAAAAGEHIGVDSSGIIKAIKKNGQSRAGGYRWEFYDG